jgi:hypothetical protein
MYAKKKHGPQAVQLEAKMKAAWLSGFLNYTECAARPLR